MTILDTRGVDTGDRAPDVCIKTYPSGIYFDLLDPQVFDVKPGDIAHHLSLLNRFVGGTPTAYSVGEHCLLVSNLCERGTGDRTLALAGLLHDATEAYLGDVSGLLKKTDDLAGYREVEHRLSRVIEKRFGLADGMLDDPVVKHYDKLAFEFECSAVRDAPWRIPPTAASVKEGYLRRLGDLRPIHLRGAYL
jgi:hypothetical protein